MSQLVDQIGNAVTSTRIGTGKSVSGGKQAIDVNIAADDVGIGGGGGGVGPIPPAATTTINTFSTVAAVASAATTDIVSYTVPVGKTFYLSYVEFSGENIADFEVLSGVTVIAKKRTYFGGQLSGEFLFERTRFAATTIVKLRVTHARPTTGDFEGRINGWEV